MATHYSLQQYEKDTMKRIGLTLIALMLLGAPFATDSFGEQGKKKATTEVGELDMTGTHGSPPRQYAIVAVPRGDIKEVSDSPFLDAKVKSPDGENVGTLDKLIMDTKTGKIEYGVVELEGSERLVPVAWSAFKTNRESGRVVLNATKEQLQPSLNFEDAKDLSPDIKHYFDSILQKPMQNR
jgi:sporulation protein YlmC with PRC-barrel domain